MFRRNFAKNPNGETRAGEGLAIDNLLRQAELQPCLPYFIFKQLPQRLDQLEMHLVRQPADIVMALDHLRGIAFDRDAFNHIRIKRALR